MHESGSSEKTGQSRQRAPKLGDPPSALSFAEAPGLGVVPTETHQLAGSREVCLLGGGRNLY